MPDSPSPDTKGAQPEQLLEEVREYLDRFTVGVDMLPPYLLDLATALSECREALREIDDEALEVARLAVEDTLVEMRDSRISIVGRGNGFVIREPDGQDSSMIRLGTPEGLRIGIAAYLAARAAQPPSEASCGPLITNDLSETEGGRRAVTPSEQGAAQLPSEASERSGTP